MNFQPGERVCDMSNAEQRAWEQGEMALPCDFMKILDEKASSEDRYICRIDAAPFQLVKDTSLLKVFIRYYVV